MAREAAAAFGGAIKRAREQRGLSQADVARLVGKTQSAVSLWEQGRRAPDFDDLVTLVVQLGVDLDDIVGRLGGTRGVQSAKALLRAQAERLASDEVADAVERLIDEAEVTEAPPAELRIGSESPIGAAQELLAKAGISKPPVPVDDVANRCGVRVAPLDVRDGISGLLLELDSGAVIGYAVHEIKARRRFTIAHELGHHVLRHYDNFHIDPYGTASDGDPPGYNWRDERAANEFAAQLLMPAAWVAAQFRRTKNLAVLASTFEVSREAMGYRLANLGLR